MEVANMVSWEGSAKHEARLKLHEDLVMTAETGAPRGEGGPRVRAETIAAAQLNAAAISMMSRMVSTYAFPTTDRTVCPSAADRLAGIFGGAKACRVSATTARTSAGAWLLSRCRSRERPKAPRATVPRT